MQCSSLRTYFELYFSPKISLTAMLGLLRMELLWGVALATGALSALFDITYLAHLPEVVGRQHLEEGNSKVSASTALTEVAAFPLGGWLVQLLMPPLPCWWTR